jgi:hypothetical protein
VGAQAALAPEKDGSDQQDRQHSKHHDHNGGPVNLPHRLSLTLSRPLAKRNCIRQIHEAMRIARMEHEMAR